MARCGDDRWYLSVADSGQGFPAEFKARFLDATEKSFGMKLMKASLVNSKVT